MYNDRKLFPLFISEKTDNNTNSWYVIEQSSEQKKSVEKAMRDSVVSKFKINCSLTSPNQNELRSENGIKISSEREGESESSNKRESDDVGLHNASQILRLFRRVLDLLLTMIYFLQDLSVQSYENNQNH